MFCPGMGLVRIWWQLDGSIRVKVYSVYTQCIKCIECQKYIQCVRSAYRQKCTLYIHSTQCIRYRHSIYHVRSGYSLYHVRSTHCVYTVYTIRSGYNVYTVHTLLEVHMVYAQCIYHVRRGYSVEAYMVYTVYIMLVDLRSSEFLSLVLYPWNLLLLYPFAGTPFIPLSKDAFTSQVSSDLKIFQTTWLLLLNGPKWVFFVLGRSTRAIHREAISL